MYLLLDICVFEKPYGRLSWHDVLSITVFDPMMRRCNLLLKMMERLEKQHCMALIGWTGLAKYVGVNSEIKIGIQISK